jgi:hypothetical protein
VQRNQVLVRIGTRTETPSEDLLKPLFAPVDLNHVPLDAGTVTSGLGLDKERFFQSFGLERGHFCG